MIRAMRFLAAQWWDGAQMITAAVVWLARLVRDIALFIGLVIVLLVCMIFDVEWL